MQGKEVHLHSTNPSTSWVWEVTRQSHLQYGKYTLLLLSGKGEMHLSIYGIYAVNVKFPEKKSLSCLESFCLVTGVVFVFNAEVINSFATEADT